MGGNHLEFFFNKTPHGSHLRLVRNREQPSMIQGKPPLAGDKPPLASQCHLIGIKGGCPLSLPFSQAARSQFSFILMDCTTGRRGKINFLPIKCVWGKCPTWTPRVVPSFAAQAPCCRRTPPHCCCLEPGGAWWLEIRPLITLGNRHWADWPTLRPPLIRTYIDWARGKLASRGTGGPELHPAPRSLQGPGLSC